MVVRLSAIRFTKIVTIRKIRSSDKSAKKRFESERIICPRIIHGDIIKDRKSSFQGHVAEVHSVEDVVAVISKLMQNKKIYDATHNILAYRIEQTTDRGPTTVEDSDDDGETHAGSRLLKLLQILEQKNTVVVVSRWFGGIQLGSDRFHHINDAAKQAMQQAGLIKK